MYKKLFKKLSLLGFKGKLCTKLNNGIYGLALSNVASSLTRGHGGGGLENTIIIKNNEWGND